MRPRSEESTETLGKILDVFAAGRADELGQIRNGILAGVLAELIAYRKSEDAELDAVRVRFGHLQEIEGVPRIALAGARLKSALAEFHKACEKTLGDPGDGKLELVAVEAVFMGMIDKLVDTIMQNATAPGDVQEPDETVEAPLLDEAKIVP